MPIFRQHPDLMARLTKAQNHPGNLSRDVMTFAGFCDDRAELLRHVEACEASAAEWDRLRTLAATCDEIVERAMRSGDQRIASLFTKSANEFRARSAEAA
jgi:hypothetical protein